MSELENQAQQLAQDFLDGKIDAVVEALTDEGIPRSVSAFLAADIASRLDVTARGIFRSVLHIRANKDYSDSIED